MKEWEKAQGLPDRALCKLARNENSVFQKIFDGDVHPREATAELLEEMKSASDAAWFCADRRGMRKVRCAFRLGQQKPAPVK